MKNEQPKKGQSPLPAPDPLETRMEKRLRANPGTMMIVAGIALATCGVILAFLDQQVTGIGFGTLGVSLCVLGALLPRLEGAFSIGPNGFSATLSRAIQIAQRYHVDEGDLENYLLAIYEKIESLDRRELANFDAVDKQMEEVAASFDPGMEDRRYDEVDPRLWTAMADFLGEDEPLPEERVDGVRQRKGRGAPRWEVTLTTGKKYRVSNTKWGWTVRGL